MGRRRTVDLDQVVAAAIAVVAEEGPDALGVSRVARALGIQPPSLYNHVGKGDALARAVVIEGNRQLLGVLKEAARAEDGAADQLRALARASRGWARENPGLYTVMARTPPENDHPGFRPVLDDVLDLFGRPLGRLGVPRAVRVHAIRGLRAAIHGFLLLETSGQFALAEDPEESFRRLVEALIAGVGAWSDPG